MDFSYILKTAVPARERLLDSGFEEKEGVLVKKVMIEDGEFYALLKLSPDEFTAEVYEAESSERYVLADVESAAGGFVGSIREQVRKAVEGVRDECLDATDIKERYCKALASSFGTEPDFPWADTPDYGVYRAENGKWYALVMKIKLSCLGIKSSEKVWVVNLKADEERIPSLIDGKSIFTAYHMSHTHWITVLLTSVTDFDSLMSLTRRSRELVMCSGKKKRR